MKLLIVTFSYAPALSPRAFRWTALAEAWAGQGHEVTVIAAAYPEEPADGSRQGVRVIRCAGPLQRFRRPEPLQPTHRGPTSLRARALRTVYQGLVKPLQWPDYAWDWIPAATRAAHAVLGRRDFDALITVSHPFSPHWVGHRLGKLRPKRWIVDIGDPFAFLDATPLNAPHFRARNFSAERKVLEGASLVAVTTTETMAAYEEAFPSAASKLRVIGPLLSWEGPEPPPNDSPGPRRLVYVGTLYRTIRSPEPALQLLRALRAQPGGDDWELHFYGSLNDCQDLLMEAGPGVIVHGKVSRAAAVEAMVGATVLLNLGNRTRFQLPSKLVEYAATGRPIVNVVENPDDSSANFLLPYPSVWTVVEPQHGGWDTLAVEVLEFLERVPGILPRSEVKAWLEPFCLPSIRREYEELLA